MNFVQTQDINEQVILSSEQTLPAAPFPRKYVHSMFDDLKDAVPAALALRAAGYNDEDIHVFMGRDYVEAVERRQTPLGSLLSHNYDAYLQEANRGRYILAVRLPSYEHMLPIRDLLRPHHAHVVKYIDTWAGAELLP